MFKSPSFYYFLEFHCKILNSYAIYRRKEMVKILKCYLIPKKSYGTLSKGAIFLANPVVWEATTVNETVKKNDLSGETVFTQG